MPPPGGGRLKICVYVHADSFQSKFKPIFESFNKHLAKLDYVKWFIKVIPKVQVYDDEAHFLWAVIAEDKKENPTASSEAMEKRFKYGFDEPNPKMGWLPDGKTKYPRARAVLAGVVMARIQDVAFNFMDDLIDGTPFEFSVDFDWGGAPDFDIDEDRKKSKRVLCEEIATVVQMMGAAAYDLKASILLCNHDMTRFLRIDCGSFGARVHPSRTFDGREDGSKDRLKWLLKITQDVAVENANSLQFQMKVKRPAKKTERRSRRRDYSDDDSF